MDPNTPTSPRRARSFAVAMLALCMLPGCEATRDWLDAQRKPTAALRGVKLQDVDLTKATLLFDVEVKNPYAVDLPLIELAYGLASGGEQFATGRAELDGVIPANGSRTVTVPAMVVYEHVLTALEQIKPGAVVPYTADLTLTAHEPAIGKFDLPLRKEGELPVPAVPKVELRSMRWQELTLQKASAVMELRLGNTNAFPIELGGMDYGLALGGQRVLETKLAEAAKIKPGEAATLRVPISLSPAELGLAALNMLRGDDAAYTIGGTMKVGTPYGPITMPFEQSGRTMFRR